MVAAAIIGAGALGAGASIYGSSNAASAQTAASQQSIAAQKKMFEEAKTALQPFITGGSNALPGLSKFIDPNDASSPLNALLKLVMPGSNQSETLAQTPGFQFAEDRGLRAINNALAARGLAGSGGAVAKGAADYTTGLAQQTWQSVINNLLNTFSQGAGAQQGLVSTGANAAGNLAGGAISSGKGIGDALVGIGNAQAGANIATGNAIGSAGNAASQAYLWNQLVGGGSGGNAGGSMYGSSGVGNALGAGAYGAAG